MHQKIEILEALNFGKDALFIDVRSPSEYTHACIPLALNIPLFDDEQRAVIGTIYKKQCRQDAIKKGLEIFGPKMRSIVEQVETSIQKEKKHVIVYCWRGGMRSEAICWLLNLYGFEVSQVIGGYKSFRNFVLSQFDKKYLLHVLGGNTGSGKTKLLTKYQEEGKNTIDLEGLACHKGSAFGHINMPSQPSQEMFENKLALTLFRYGSDEEIWLEDESTRLGHVGIPKNFYLNMQSSPITYMNVDFKIRLKNIIDEYGKFDPNELTAAVDRISKRLGGLQTKNVKQCIAEGNIEDAFANLLQYYDKAYEKKKR